MIHWVWQVRPVTQRAYGWCGAGMRVNQPQLFHAHDRFLFSLRQGGLDGS